MFLDVLIEVKLGNSNVKHYENLGYDIPKHRDYKNRLLSNLGETILVKPEDVLPNTKVKIPIICDICLKEGRRNICYKFPSYIHNERRLHNGEDYCDDCRIKRTYKNCGLANRLKEEDVFEYFSKNDYTPQFTYSEYKNDGVKLPYICNKHTSCGVQYVSIHSLKRSNGRSCKMCRSEIYNSRKNPNWQGGISFINDYFRKIIIDWKKESLQWHNYTCPFTGSKDVHVHHLVPFKFIVDKAMEELSIPMCENISFYSDNQLLNITNKIKELHDYYGYGFVINKDLHNLFHYLYGVKNNDYIQLKNFEARLQSGKFDNFLEEHNLTKII